MKNLLLAICFLMAANAIAQPAEPAYYQRTQIGLNWIYDINTVRVNRLLIDAAKMEIDSNGRITWYNNSLPTPGAMLQGNGSYFTITPLGTPGQVWTVNAGGTAGEWAAAGGTITAPNQQILYGTGGGFGTEAGFEYDYATNNRLTVKQFNLPTTSGGDGIIYQNGIKWIYTYVTGLTAPSIFIGAGTAVSGNLTHTGDGANYAMGGANMTGLTTGNQNIGIGYRAMEDATTAGSNVAVGTISQPNNIGAIYNVSVGNNTLEDLVTGNRNTAIGASAGNWVNDGYSNVMIGDLAGNGGTSGTSIVSGDYNTFIGAETDVTSNTISSSIAIGYGAEVTANNQAVIGSDKASGMVNDIYLGNGVTSTVPENVTINATGGKGSDINGADLIIAAGKATGGGTGGDIIFEVSDLNTVAATTLHPLMEAARIDFRNNLQMQGRIGDYAGVSPGDGEILQAQGGYFEVVPIGTAGQILKVNGTADGVEWGAASSGVTDLSFTGSSSPVTLNSSTGTDVTITAAGINTLSATSSNITITGTEVDGSTTNEVQNLSYDAVNHEVDISLSGTSAVIPLSVDDGATEGLASFTAVDFNVTAGNVAIDYANGQAATSGQDGFLQSTDWTTFNNKGDVSKVGTPVNNQIGVWTGDGTIEGDANLTWDGNVLDVNGYSNVTHSVATQTTSVNAHASQSAPIYEITDGAGNTYFQIGLTGKLVLARYANDNVSAVKVGNLGASATGNNLEIVNGTSGVVTSFDINGKIGEYNNSAITNGQLLIGHTANGTFEKATMTGTGGITITNGAGTIDAALNINGLTQETGALDVTGDFIPLYDASEGANNKVTKEALQGDIKTFRRQRYQYFNEFINGVNTTAADGNGVVAANTGTGAGSTSTGNSSASNVVGLVSMTTGTTATGRTSVTSANSALFFSGGEWVYELRIDQIAALSTGTERYQLLVGFFDATTANQTDGAYFLYDEGGVSTGSAASANWQTVTASNSGRTFNTSGTAVGTGSVILTIVVNAAGTQVDFYIDGTNTGTAHTTNIPTTTARLTGFGIMLLKSVGTTARTLNIDYLSVECDYTTAK